MKCINLHSQKTSYGFTSSNLCCIYVIFDNRSALTNQICLPNTRRLVLKNFFSVLSSKLNMV